MFRETGNKQISGEVYNVIGGDKSIEEKLRVKDERVTGTAIFIKLL